MAGHHLRLWSYDYQNISIVLATREGNLHLQSFLIRYSSKLNQTYLEIY
jgi:hypothetical protein